MIKCFKMTADVKVVDALIDLCCKSVGQTETEYLSPDASLTNQTN